jgi:hypothetical protein
MATPNTLFVVLNVSNPEGVNSRLGNIAPWVSYDLKNGQWLIVAPSATTAKEVSDKIGLSDGAETGLVVRVENYFGRNYQVLWDWITTKMGAELVPIQTA